MMIRIPFHMLAILLILGSAPAFAQSGTVPVMERADPAGLDTCALGKVAGLNSKGDNFLAVRAGPGPTYVMLDKLRPDTPVSIFDTRGNWLGVAYGSPDIKCSPVKTDRPYAGPGRAGWVFKKYVRLVAG